MQHEMPAGRSTTSASTACGVKRACVCPTARESAHLGGIGAAVGAMCPIAPNVIWALHFQFDQTSDCRILELLNVIDEYSRECLAIVVERSIDADGVVRFFYLARANVLGPSRRALSTTGPGSSPTLAAADWCRFNSTDTGSIYPGSPWQNAWIESFNGRLRDEFSKRPTVRNPVGGKGPPRGLEDRLQHEQASQRE